MNSVAIYFMLNRTKIIIRSTCWTYHYLKVRLMRDLMVLANYPVNDYTLTQM